MNTTVEPGTPGQSSVLARFPEPSSAFAALPRMYRDAFNGAAKRARKRLWRCLSKAEFLEVVARANGRCELTGHPFEDRAYVVPWRGRRPFKSYPWAPSLDRRNIESGYELENVRLVCASVNGALSYLPDEVFAEMCRAFVAKHGMPPEAAALADAI